MFLFNKLAVRKRRICDNTYSDLPFDFWPGKDRT
jgi:hypothetical protein